MNHLHRERTQYLAAVFLYYQVYFKKNKQTQKSQTQQAKKEYQKENLIC